MRSFAEMVGEIMNPYIKEYAELVKDYEAKKGKRETVLALYEFSDRLKKAGDKDAKTVLVDVYKRFVVGISSVCT